MNFHQYDYFIYAEFVSVYLYSDSPFSLVHAHPSQFISSLSVVIHKHIYIYIHKHATLKAPQPVTLCLRTVLLLPPCVLLTLTLQRLKGTCVFGVQWMWDL